MVRKKEVLQLSLEPWEVSSSAVVFNLFHAATNFATQFNLTTPSENFQSVI